VLHPFQVGVGAMLMRALPLPLPLPLPLRFLLPFLQRTYQYPNSFFHKTYVN
jgi:hypothetical protein